MSDPKLTINEPALNVNRILYEHHGDPDQPCVVVFCGVHGNEKAGIKALDRMLPFLESAVLTGSVFVLSGNIPALVSNQRFIDKDLNRLWKREVIHPVYTLGSGISENRDRKELLALISGITQSFTGALYFVDIHTTSAPSVPFVTMDDSLINRRFTTVFPVPVVLGIEEYLQGALLSYINQLGFVSLGFEAGEHRSEQSVTNAESFLYLVFSVSGILTGHEQLIKKHWNILAKSSGKYRGFFEVTYKYTIGVDEHFTMRSGYENFQSLSAGETIAESDGVPVKTGKEALIFMPLYQEQGEDGYFFVRKIPSWVLRVSAGLRLLRSDSLLTLLPGVSWVDESKHALRVDLRVARFLARPFFHLLGYRELSEDTNHLLLYNRERASQKERYPFRYPKL